MAMSTLSSHLVQPQSLELLSMAGQSGEHFEIFIKPSLAHPLIPLLPLTVKSYSMLTTAISPSLSYHLTA